MATIPLRADSVRANPAVHSQNLQTAVSSALRIHGIPPSRFGRDALRDPQFVRDLMHRDRKLRPATEAKVRDYIAALGEGR